MASDVLDRWVTASTELRPKIVGQTCPQSPLWRCSILCETFIRTHAQHNKTQNIGRKNEKLKLFVPFYGWKYV